MYGIKKGDNSRCSLFIACSFLQLCTAADLSLLQFVRFTTFMLRQKNHYSVVGNQSYKERDLTWVKIKYLKMRNALRDVVFKYAPKARNEFKRGIISRCYFTLETAFAIISSEYI